MYMYTIPSTNIYIVYGILYAGIYMRSYQQMTQKGTLHRVVCL